MCKTSPYFRLYNRRPRNPQPTAKPELEPVTPPGARLGKQKSRRPSPAVLFYFTKTQPTPKQTFQFFDQALSQNDLMKRPVIILNTPAVSRSFTTRMSI